MPKRARSVSRGRSSQRTPYPTPKKRRGSTAYMNSRSRSYGVRSSSHASSGSGAGIANALGRSGVASTIGSAAGGAVGGPIGALVGGAAGSIADGYLANVAGSSKVKFSGGGTYAPVTMTKVVKKVGFKRPMKVRVNKAFREKVNKVLEASKYYGNFKQVSYSALTPNAVPVNTQFVGALNNTSSDYSNWCFGVADMLHMVSVLWNNKADSQGTRDPLNIKNFGYVGSGFTTGTVAPGNETANRSNSNNPLNTKFKLKWANELFHMKNNSQRAVTMKIYLFAPKVRGTSSTTVETMTDTSEGSATNILALEPVNNWGFALNQEYNQNKNISNMGTTQLFCDPCKNASLKKIYNIQCTEILLQPGQVYEYTVHGPTNLELDYSKMFYSRSSNVSIFMDVQKFMRFPVVVHYPELVSGSTSGYARAPGSATSEKIVIERTRTYSFEMPEEAFGTLYFPIAASSITVKANLKRNCYFHTVYAPAAVVGNVERVHPEDPNTEEVL